MRHTGRQAIFREKVLFTDELLCAFVVEHPNKTAGINEKAHAFFSRCV